MKRLLPFLVALLAASLVAADQPTLVITPAGYQYLVIDSSGTAVLSPVERIVDLRGDGTPPGPTDPDPPTPEPEAELVRQVTAWAGSVEDPNGAQAIAMVYRQVAEAVADGTLEPDRAFQSIRMSTDAALSAAGAAKDWGSVREKLSGVATARLQAGDLSGAAAMASFLRAVAAGMAAAADGSSITFDAIIQMTRAVNKAMEVQ